MTLVLLLLLFAFPAFAGEITTPTTVDYTKTDVGTKTPPAGATSQVYATVEFYNIVPGGTVQLILLDEKGNVVLSGPPQTIPNVGWWGLGIWSGTVKPSPKNGFSVQVVPGDGAKIDLVTTSSGFNTGAALVNYDKTFALDPKTPAKDTTSTKGL